MKKLLLLGAVLFSVLSVNAQKVTIFHEDFDPPDSVITGVRGWATDVWVDTNNLFIQSNSYHGKVQANDPVNPALPNDAYFQTDTFSTVGYNHVYLSFYTISKINAINEGLISISTDGGTSWTTFLSSNVAYQGGSTWNSSNAFHEGVYDYPNLGINDWSNGFDAAADSTWWKYESFDISDLALGTAGTGFSQVIIEFSANWVIDPNILPIPRPFGEGWYIDHLKIEASSTCEIFPPRFKSFDYLPTTGVCFPPLLQGAILIDTTGNYPVGARLVDSVAGNYTAANTSGIATVRVNYRIIDQSGTVGPWQQDTLSLVSAVDGEYEGTMNGILLGDTVEYYYEAFDNGCPNYTRFPDSLLYRRPDYPNSPYLKWYPVFSLPSKCGVPFCNTAPGTINTFPWVEDFETGDWQAGFGDSDDPTISTWRGGFPDAQQGMSYWSVQPGTGTAAYAWSVANGTTKTDFTGPLTDHSTTGNNFVYAEASHSPANTTTTLTTPCIDLTNQSGCLALDFYYHFFGEDVGTMRIDIDTGSDAPAWYTGYYFIRKEQQDSAEEDWKRAVVPLYDFNGQFIRLRFLSAKQTTKTGVDIRGDMAIDDLRIYETPQFDAELIEIASPVAGSCSYGTEDIELVIRNNGCDSLYNVPISYRLRTNGVPGTVQTHNASVALKTGDTVTYTIPSAVNLSATGNTYQIEIWTSLSGDALLSNDTALSEEITHYAPHITFPLIMDFEGLAAGFPQTGASIFEIQTDLDPNFKFVVGNRYTSTRSTGPKGGYYFGNGQYLYTEATGSAGDVATYLTTNGCLDFSSLTDPTLDFYYHMYGADIDRLAVEVSDPSTMEPNEWAEITGSSVSPSHLSEVDNYDFKRVDLSAYAGLSIRLRIVAYRKFGGDLADIALDKIMIYDRIANDAGVELVMESPLLLGLIADSTVQTLFPPPGNAVRANVNVRNFGTSNLSNEAVTIAVTPLCGVNKGVTTTYNTDPALMTTITPGNTTLINDLNVPFVLPKGDCEVCAYLNVTGDNNAFNDTACRIIAGRGYYEMDFFTDFDSCDYDQTGFFSQTGGGAPFRQWEFGQALPGTQFFNNQINSGNNIWATNLNDGFFLDGTEENLLTPFINVPDSIVSPFIRFYQNVDMGSDAAGAIEANYGGTWNALGATLGTFGNVGQNWYSNPNFGTVASTLSGIEVGFTNSSAPDGGWVLSEYPMSELNFNGNNIPFRFRFESNFVGNTSLDGWAIDDFHLFIPTQHSASPYRAKFVQPLQIPTFDQELDVFISNTGYQLLDSCEVRVEIYNQGMAGDPNGFVWAGNWQKITLPLYFVRGSGKRYRYNDIWPGHLVQSGNYDLMVITRRPNGRPTDDETRDDTLVELITVLSEYAFNDTTNMISYCNDFEPNNGAYPLVPYHSIDFTRGSTWAKGVPSQFPNAYSGQEVWMTGLDTNYGAGDESSLVSPVFVIPNDTNFEFSFMHMFNTEKYHDGGGIEWTLDGGLTWEVLGSIKDSTSWYNTQFVTSLDIINPGWSDTLNYWDTASYVFRMDTSQRVVFRWRFASDYEFEEPGWAIDDFCLEMTSKPIQGYIGEGEYVSSQQSYIGLLSPNPSVASTSLEVYLERPSEVVINVVNALGQQIYSSKEKLDAGSNDLYFETMQWGAGIYFVNVEMDGELYTRKLIVN